MALQYERILSTCVPGSKIKSYNVDQYFLISSQSLCSPIGATIEVNDDLLYSVLERKHIATLYKIRKKKSQSV
jgi:hypothetical protein